MKTILRKIGSLVLYNRTKNHPIPLTATSFDFIKTRKAILRELMLSKTSRTVVGIYCKGFGEGMFLTTVDEIEQSMSGEVVAFHPYDISGRIINHPRVALHEIQMVCPFYKTYERPPISNSRDITLS